MSFNTVGWDIGGAHLKAALLNADGVVLHVYQQPCPLWKGLTYLETAVQQILQWLPDTARNHALTMTGELVDFFASRDEGVAEIIAVMQRYLGKEEILVYAGKQGFIAVAQITPAHYVDIASANWLASASLVAQKTATALFMDVGSTTTDVLLCADNAVRAIGLTDYERLQSQELIYTGIVRTPVSAVTQAVFFQGQPIGIMTEYFATMADIYRLTGELNEACDQNNTADGGEKTVLASAKRLSRTIGNEFKEDDLFYYQQLASQLKQQQKWQLQKACLRQLSRIHANSQLCFIGAGIGRFLVKQIANDLGYAYRDFTDFVTAPMTASSMTVADCAPAVAMAYLSRVL